MDLIATKVFIVNKIKTTAQVSLLIDIANDTVYTMGLTDLVRYKVTSQTLPKYHSKIMCQSKCIKFFNTKNEISDQLSMHLTY